MRLLVRRTARTLALVAIFVILTCTGAHADQMQYCDPQHGTGTISTP